MSNWTIFSNHGHVLVCLARDPEARLRDVAADVGLTERAVQKIVRDLQIGGMIEVSKHGRRNSYRIDHNQTLRHNLEAHCTIGSLIELLIDEPDEDVVLVASKAITLQQADIEPATEPVSITEDETPVETKPEEQTDKSGMEPEEHTVKGGVERQQGSLF